MSARLGIGADGPWEARPHRVRAWASSSPPNEFGSRVVSGHLNGTYSVQLARHPEAEGVDHLIIRRHDSADVTATWDELQRIKNRICPDGQFRFAVEVYPPRRYEVREYPLRHLFVMPTGWTPPFGGLHSDQDPYLPT